MWLLMLDDTVRAWLIVVRVQIVIAAGGIIIINVVANWRDG